MTRAAGCAHPPGRRRVGSLEASRCSTFAAEFCPASNTTVGAGRVGLRISPAHNVQGVLEPDADDVEATYGALVDQIAPLGLAYLSILHAEPSGDLVQGLRARFGGPVIVNSGFGTITSRDEARSLVDENVTDAVAVGRLAIANPDLVRRWREDRVLNEIDQSTFYSPGAAGYTDYPALLN